MALNNGIISAPVAAKEVYDCLGVGKLNGTWYDISYICENSHGKINKWAKFKPVRFNKIQDLTVNDFFVANHGLDLNGAYDVSIENLFIKAGNKPDWDYLPPTPTDWKRITDFDGYNHGAKPFFTYNFPTYVETYVPNTTIDISVSKDASSELWFNDFAWFEDHGGSLANFKWGIVYLKDGETDYHFFTGQPLTDTTLPIVISVTFRGVGSGTFRCLFIATRETEETTNVMESMYMPFGQFTVHINRLYVTGIVTFTNFDTLNIFIDQNIIYGLRLITLSIIAKKGSMDNTIGKIGFYFECKDSSGHTVGTFTVYDTTEEFSYQGNTTQTYTIDFLEGAPINIENYIDGSLLTDLTEIVVYALVEEVSGNGVFKTDQIYTRTINV